MIDLLTGFFAPWLIYAGIVLLHVLLPARRVQGYVLDERRGEPLRYRLNGLLVLAVSVGVWLAAGYSGVMPWDWLWTHRWPGAAGAFGLGLIATAAPRSTGIFGNGTVGRCPGGSCRASTERVE